MMAPSCMKIVLRQFFIQTSVIIFFSNLLFCDKNFPPAKMNEYEIQVQQTINWNLWKKTINHISMLWNIQLENFPSSFFSFLCRDLCRECIEVTNIKQSTFCSLQNRKETNNSRLKYRRTECGSIPSHRIRFKISVLKQAPTMTSKCFKVRRHN